MGVVPLTSLSLANLGLGEELCLRRPSDPARTVRIARVAGRPHAFLLKDVLTRAECAEIMRAAKEHGMHPAETSGGTDDRKRCDVGCLRPADAPIVRAYTQDVAELLLSDAARGPGGGCEDLHVLRYEPGGEFKLHFDAGPSKPRALTVLTYLNECGGATWFPLADSAREPRDPSELGDLVGGLRPEEHGLRVAGSMGSALAFFNFADHGALDALALHAGLPAPDTRWVASHFFHAGAMSSSSPDRTGKL